MKKVYIVLCEIHGPMGNMMSWPGYAFDNVADADAMRAKLEKLAADVVIDCGEPLTKLGITSMSYTLLELERHETTPSSDVELN